MRRKTNLLQVIAFALTIALAPLAAFALGADHPKENVSSSAWPKGMSALVNSPERVHGYFVNAEDVFFFVGNQVKFHEFLQSYARIDGTVSHKIVVHDGLGRAKSPWQNNEGFGCDWMIYGAPASWKHADTNAEGYILEIHVWKDGDIKIDDLSLPDGILIEPAKKTEQDGRGNE